MGIADNFHARKHTGGKSHINKIGDETGRLTPMATQTDFIDWRCSQLLQNGYGYHCDICTRVYKRRVHFTGRKIWNL